MTNPGETGPAETGPGGTGRGGTTTGERSTTEAHARSGLRVAVTGATGNVGTGVVERLATDERVGSVVAIARRPPDALPAKVEFRRADVADDDMAPLFEGADVVVHLAWLFQPTHRPMATWRANVEGSTRVFDAVSSAGVGALVYASSVGAYSPGHGDVRVDESWPTHSVPTAAYGREKAYIERVLDAFECRHPSVRVVRLRPAFTFKRASATQQRRLFAGPLLPGAVVAPGRLPAVPFPAGLRFQALHTDDVAEAYRLAVTGDARGPFNLAAEPVIDAAAVARALGSRTVPVPARSARAALAAAWHARAVPAEPALFDLAMSLPLMATARAREELGWEPRRTAEEALRDMLEGLAAGAGGQTPPLAADSVSGRAAELRTALTAGDTP
jgi:nucleoside-diphosphate-sugar epimerase